MGWLVVCLVGCLVGWLRACLAGWLVGSHVHINYVSTIGVIQERSGVLAAENTLVSEEKNYHVSSGSSSGYEQSKWVSEMLFAQLHKHEYDRACTYTIFRPGMISWDPESGRGNMVRAACCVNWCELGARP